MLAGAACRHLAVVFCPGVGRIVPVMTQNRNVIHRLGLLGKCGIGEHCRVGRLTLGLTSGRLRYFAGSLNSLGLHVSRIMLADAACRHLAVVSRPSVGRIVPVVTKSRNVIHRLGLRGKSGICKRRRIGRLTLCLAGSGLCHFAGSVNRLGLYMKGIMIADTGSCHTAVVFRPGVGWIVPVMAQSNTCYDLRILMYHTIRAILSGKYRRVCHLTGLRTSGILSTRGESCVL